MKDVWRTVDEALEEKEKEISASTDAAWHRLVRGNDKIGMDPTLGRSENIANHQDLWYRLICHSQTDLNIITASEPVNLD